MTERLAQLMRAETYQLAVPAPNPSAVLAQGHGLRRRRRLTAGAGAFAALAVIAGSAVGVNALTGDDGDGKAEPAAPFDSGAVFSIANNVYLDDAKMQATIDDTAIKSLHYTSVGVLVRHGDDAWSDGGGPQRFSMVRPDGSVDRLDITLEETVHSTDPTQPYMAYALVADGQAEVVVRDLRDDTEVARVPIPSADPGGGWAAPPVSLAGDIVYVGTGLATYAVNWRGGTVEETDRIEPGMPDVHGGREVTSSQGGAAVVDVATGEELLSTKVGRNEYAYYNLSPDGRYAILSVESMDLSSPPPVEVYSVDTGASVTLPTADYGWTGLGDLFTVSKNELTTCSASTGDCTTAEHGIQMPPKTAPQEVCYELEGGGTECYTEGGETWEGQLKLGGRLYES